MQLILEIFQHIFAKEVLAANHLATGFLLICLNSIEVNFNITISEQILCSYENVSLLEKHPS